MMMEEQSQDTAAGGQAVKDEKVDNEDLTEAAAPDTEEEDEEALPHSEILDIFEEGLARLVQDPLLCDLPIQVSTRYIQCPGIKIVLKLVLKYRHSSIHTPAFCNLF